jgi:truncated hemoglobin YjbI
MHSAEKPSLYDRLGGAYSIATVVDDFIDRIMKDPKLNANPLVDEAHHRVPPAGFKYLVTEMVCWAAGGPQKYTGKSMADSHSHLKIGQMLELGEAVRLSITGPCPRCVMTTLPQDDLPRDTGILRTAAQHNRANVGVYASVVQGGTIRRGDSVRLG